MTQTTMDFSSNYAGQKEAAKQHFLVLKKKEPSTQIQYPAKKNNNNNNDKNPSK